MQEKFPAPPAAPSRRVGHLLRKASPLDALIQGAITEFVGATGDASLYLASLLSAAGEAGLALALVDAGGSFDPGSFGNTDGERVLWVVCRGAEQAVKAADLLLRDGNLPLLLLDFHSLSRREIQRIPASTWHRFHRIAEQGSMALVVLSPRPLVEGARTRIVSTATWTLAAMRRRRRALVEEMDVKVFDRGKFTAALERELKSA